MFIWLEKRQLLLISVIRTIKVHTTHPIDDIFTKGLDVKQRNKLLCGKLHLKDMFKVQVLGEGAGMLSFKLTYNKYME